MCIRTPRFWSLNANYNFNSLLWDITESTKIFVSPVYAYSMIDLIEYIRILYYLWLVTLDRRILRLF